jgi:hypothetical protein
MNIDVNLTKINRCREIKRVFVESAGGSCIHNVLVPRRTSPIAVSAALCCLTQQSKLSTLTEGSYKPQTPHQLHIEAENTLETLNQHL